MLTLIIGFVKRQIYICLQSI